MSHNAAKEFAFVRLARHDSRDARFTALDRGILNVKPKAASAILCVSTVAMPTVFGQNGLHIALKVNVAECWLTEKNEGDKRTRCEETRSGNVHE
jgi:hypothetical protein